MKKILALLSFLLILSSCSKNDDEFYEPNIIYINDYWLNFHINFNSGTNGMTGYAFSNQIYERNDSLFITDKWYGTPYLDSYFYSIKIIDLNKREEIEFDFEFTQWIDNDDGNRNKWIEIYIPWEYYNYYIKVEFLMKIIEYKYEIK